jgi:hypothetical protein
MKTYTFNAWITVRGNKIYKELTFTANSWQDARKMLSDAMKAEA